jgi:hypothetical protein
MKHSFASMLDHNMRSGAKMDMHHMHMMKTGEGHVIEHHTAGHEIAHSQKFPHFSGPAVSLPEGHVLTHIAKHMGIPHEIVAGGEAEKVPEEVTGTEGAGAAY